jgi:xanthine dehydrogenase accessory factor
MVGREWIEELLHRTRNHEVVVRTLDMHTGQVTLATANRQAQFEFDGAVMRAPFGPRWRLLIVGAGQLSRVIAQLALALDFQVLCCDPREEYNLTWDVPGTTFSKDMPDDLVSQIALDVHTAVVAVTHDPKLDDLVLIEALKSSAFYVGALGSRRNTETRLHRLREHFALSVAETSKLHGPIGLNIGAKTPAEIAVSVVAEIISVRNGVALVQKKPGSSAPVPVVTH